ncbi:UbiX family flavin prenyltransferase [Blautia sp.]
MKKICVGMSGASGAPIAIKLLERLKEILDTEVHLVMTHGAELTIEQETGYSVNEVKALSDFCYGLEEIGEKPASGSFNMDAMIVVPCSMKSVAGIVSGYSDNLLLRAADVTIKEGRPLILVARESSLSPIHLRNLNELAQIGVRIIPPMISYYQGFHTLEEWTDSFVERLLRALGMDGRVTEWQGM